MINLKFKVGLNATLDCGTDRTLYVGDSSTLKNDFDGLIRSNDILNSASYLQSDVEYTYYDVVEYEVNLFDFPAETTYEEVHTAAELALSEILSSYSNTRGFTVGKFVSGNSFGIKIVIVIFKLN